VARKSKRARPSAQSRSKTRKVPRNSKSPYPQSSAQLAKRSDGSKSVLTEAQKRRGPKEKIGPSEVANRAYDLKLTFEIAGKQLDWPKLLASKSTEEVEAAFETMDEGYRRKFLYRIEPILRCLRDRQFPKLNRKSQEQFIADSLAGDGRVSLRRSRDICQRERARRKASGTILRREFYIVCSCRYKGPALHDTCPKCGAEVSYLDFTTGH
jgi:hypothetical protein